MLLFKICHINARSILSDFPEFKRAVHEKYDIITVSETWLNVNILSDSISLPGYQLFRKDRKDLRGGGVAIYIKIKFRAKIINNLPASNIEQVWISFSLHHLTYAIGSVYKPPKYSAVNFVTGLEDVLGNLTPTVNYLIFAGDLNIDFLNVVSNSYNLISNVLEVFNLNQVIDQPTHITANSSTLLDVIICSSNLKCDDILAVDCPTVTDYHLVTCTFGSKKTQDGPNFYTYRDFSNFVLNDFCADLIAANFNDIFRSSTVDNKIECFSELFLNVFNRHAIIKTVKITKPKSPWLTSNLKLMMSLRNKALQRFKKTKNLAHFNYYKDLRNLTNRTVKLEKKLI